MAEEAGSQTSWKDVCRATQLAGGAVVGSVSNTDFAGMAKSAAESVQGLASDTPPAGEATTSSPEDKSREKKQNLPKPKKLDGIIGFAAGMPAIKDMLAPMATGWVMEGMEYGPENVEVVGSPDDGLFSMAINLATYNGKGKLPIPRGMYDLAASVLATIGIEDKDGSTAKALIVGMGTALLGLIGIELDKPESPAEKPGTPAGGTDNTAQFASAAKNRKTPTREEVASVLPLLSSQTGFMMALGMIKPEQKVPSNFVSLAVTVLEESGAEVPQELLGEDITAKDFIAGYAKGGLAMAQNKGWSEPSADGIAKAADVVKDKGIDDPDGAIAKGLAMVASHGTDITALIEAALEKPTEAPTTDVTANKPAAAPGSKV